MAESAASKTDSFLVCGLGSLGQYCVSVLKEFEVTVNAIEASHAPIWELPELPELVDRLLIGDCRQPALLEQAGIHQCRAILLVTSDERVNIAAAFAARSLNPNIRLVVRSAQESLNDLLGRQLGNFVAFEATQLPAPSFALAALDSETQGLFSLEDQRLRISTTRIQATHHWCDRRLLYELNTPNRRILRHFRATVIPLAKLTERLLAARFQFLKRRPPVPKVNHIVLVGLGRVGQWVATLLQDLKQPLVGVHAIALDSSVRGCTYLTS